MNCDRLRFQPPNPPKAPRIDRARLEKGIFVSRAHQPSPRHWLFGNLFCKHPGVAHSACTTYLLSALLFSRLVLSAGPSGSAQAQPSSAEQVFGWGKRFGPDCLMGREDFFNPGRQEIAAPASPNLTERASKSCRKPSVYFLGFTLLRFIFSSFISATRTRKYFFYKRGNRRDFHITT